MHQPNSTNNFNILWSTEREGHNIQRWKKKKNIYIYIYIWESINLWRSLLMKTLYHQTKTPINFWCRRGLNHRSLIQPLKTLTVELTRTYNIYIYIYIFLSAFFLFFTILLVTYIIATIFHKCLNFHHLMLIMLVTYIWLFEFRKSITKAQLFKKFMEMLNHSRNPCKSLVTFWNKKISIMWIQACIK